MRRIILILAFLWALPASATKTLTSSAAFVDPGGNPVTNGSLIFKLSGPAKLISNGQVVPFLTVTVQLDATGKVSGAPVIIANDELMPTGTYFFVKIYNANGLLVRGPEQWILSGASPIDLAGITNVNVPDPGLGSPVLQNPSGNQTIVQPGGTTFAVQGANSFNQPITSTIATGTAPLSVTSTTQVPNLNVSQLGGLNPPASAILGLTDAQAPTNKTINVGSNPIVQTTPSAGKYLRDNGTSFQPSSVAAAGAGSCSGVQFPQTLSDNVAPTCVTPPTFGASGASHAVGYVPDPGSSAGTTRFLREDATWVATASGVSESVLTSGAAQINGANSPCAAGSASGDCAIAFFANAHTITRFIFNLTITPVGCSTSSVVGVKDLTSGTLLTSSTIANNQSQGIVDSGVLSISTTAAHNIAVGLFTASVGCSTAATFSSLTATYQ